MSSTYPHQVKELPEGEHFAALVEESFSYEENGSWQSSPYLQYVVLGNSEQALAWIHAREESDRRSGGKPYTIIKVQRPAVRKTITIELE